MFKVAIVNGKGGVGKTTLTTTIASYYATQGQTTAIIDYDCQGSSTFWAQKRPMNATGIESIAAYKEAYRMTRSYYLEPKRGTDHLVIDSPAGVDLMRFQPTLKEADAIILPVLPSAIDIHAAAHFVRDLYLIGRLPRDKANLAVVANRVRKNTRIYKVLVEFLNTLDIPFLGCLRDSQNYIRATEAGMGLFELPATRTQQDRDTWQPIFEWLEEQKARKQECSAAAQSVTTISPIHSQTGTA